MNHRVLRETIADLKKEYVDIPEAPSWIEEWRNDLSTLADHCEALSNKYHNYAAEHSKLFEPGAGEGSAV